jgi:hypothetical protein
MGVSWLRIHWIIAPASLLSSDELRQKNDIISKTLIHKRYRHVMSSNGQGPSMNRTGTECLQSVKNRGHTTIQRINNPMRDDRLLVWSIWGKLNSRPRKIEKLAGEIEPFSVAGTVLSDLSAVERYSFENIIVLRCCIIYTASISSNVPVLWLFYCLEHFIRPCYPKLARVSLF